MIIFQFHLPPLNEQKRIVEKVNSLMSLLDEIEEKREGRNQKRIKLNNASLDKLLTSKDDKELKTNWKRIEENFSMLYSVPENVEKLKQAILQLAVQGKLVKQDPNDEQTSELLKKIKKEKEKLIAEGKIKKQKDLPPIKDEDKPFILPKGWLFERFGKLSINRDGERVPVSSDLRVHRQGKFDYYGASGVIDSVDDYLFDKPLLLIGEDGANLINRSTPIAFIAYGKYWVNNHAHVLDGYSLEFLKYLELFINAINIKSYVTGTAQPKMNQAKMNSIVIALPPYEEQKRIIERVNELMSLCNALKEHLKKKEEEGEKLVNAVVNKIVNLN